MPVKTITGMIKYLIILFLLSSPVIACEDHFFFRVGAGKQGNWMAQKSDGNWIGASGIAADISLGYRYPVKEWLWLDVTAQHKSQWDKGWPVNDGDEDEIDSITLGVEFKY